MVSHGSPLNVVMDDVDDMDLISPPSFNSGSSPYEAGIRLAQRENEPIYKSLAAKGFNADELNSFFEAQGLILVHNQSSNGAAVKKNQPRSSQTQPIIHCVQEVSKADGDKKLIDNTAQCPNISCSGNKANVPFHASDVPITNSGNAQPHDLRSESPWKLALTNGSSSTSSLQFFPPPSPPPNSPPTIRPPPEFLKSSQSPWQACILGYFPKSGLPFKLVEKAANNLWLRLGFQKLLMVKKGLFVFKFNSIRERDFILSKPWNFYGKSIILQPWHEGKPLEATGFSKLPVWVKFHEIPCSYWSMDGLSYIASAVGKPLQLDALTSKLDPLAFAKILVQIDASSPCPPKILVPVLNADQQSESLIPITVEYLNLPHLCSSCKLFGHILSSCPHQQPPLPSPKTKPLQGLQHPSPPSSSPPHPSHRINKTTMPSPSPKQTVNNVVVDVAVPPPELSDSPTPPPNHAFLSKIRSVDEIDGKKHNLRTVGVHEQLIDAEGFQTVVRKRNRRGRNSSSPPA